MEPPDATEDRLYDDTDYSLDFFITLKEFNDRLLEDPSYAALIQAFGTNLLYPTGSRASKRQSETRSGGDRLSVAQVRAIPHNGSLQQLGYLANSLAGVGHAIAIDPEHFAAIYEDSPRCRCLMRMVVQAAELSSIDVLAGYVSLLEPAAWLRMAYAEAEPAPRAQMRRLAALLSEQGQMARLNHILRVLLDDAIDLRDGLKAVGLGAELAGRQADEHPDLDLMHALRMALIQRLFMLATRVPRFTSQPDITVEEVLDELLHLDVEPAVAALKAAFPAGGRVIDQDAFGEPASYRTDRERGYDREHRELFEPILRHYDLIRRIGSAVSHMIGAVG